MSVEYIESYIRNNGIREALFELNGFRKEKPAYSSYRGIFEIAVFEREKNFFLVRRLISSQKIDGCESYKKFEGFTGLEAYHRYFGDKFDQVYYNPDGFCRWSENAGFSYYEDGKPHSYDKLTSSENIYIHGKLVSINEYCQFIYDNDIDIENLTEEDKILINIRFT